ncbi:MAG TPA: NAD(P)-binding domain-containing protein [Anaerolineales bacterium]|nr:NAD(P)-binding domain-containing protein [Anaerolineales bacterium]HMV97230.1 NAD(P)-binding domain-containing protein [Anaerolineales bacterium]HMX20828.1 NAD(P)-binding domain-containing protein [Anaerolineales bacterium]HMX75735.1 NAD(P)-binding domain-containing protein [Anaerolineales bacterium]HMZ44629.1 NAD(P)-binding domain-containing protein [Anaerolineales bacterium]
MKAGRVIIPYHSQSRSHFMLRVGYIGLGLMGKSIARNILKAGFPVVVHNRSRGAVDELVAEGAVAANSPKEVAEQVDVVFTNLPDSPDVEKVALGENGILAGGRAGLIVVDNSTIKPASARLVAEKLKEKGIFSLDAPVSGGDIGAKNGTLTIMVGGEVEALEKVMPVFQAMGKTITHVGDAGAGQVAKAANQIMVAAQMVAMGELLVFSKKAGVDPRKVVDAIKAGAAQCWALDIKPPRLFDGNRNPGFKSYMQLKDMKIVLDTAKEYGVPVTSTEENTRFYQMMIDMGLGELDNSAVVGVIEKLAGVEII